MTTSPSRRNIAWIVIASFLAVVLLSVVLVVIVVAGARENVIDAALLLSFAAGALLLAILSARRSDQPQRWAWGVAGWLAFAGIVLLLWPGIVATAAIGWIAPLLLLALVVWMTRRVRRELQSRVRVCLVYPVVAVVALLAIAALFESVQEVRDWRAHPMQGQLVDIGGRRLFLRCAGSGAPTVVLMQGAGEPASIWAWFVPDIARETRVCVYDRAGRAWSDDGPTQQDGMAVAADLAALLAAAREPGPYVLAGHSFGGLYVRAFAARYPEQTAGLVLLDATDPQQFTRIPPYPTFYAYFRRISALFPTLGRFGVGRLAYRGQYRGLPPDAWAEQYMWWSTSRHARSMRDEFAAAPVSMQQAGTLVTLGHRPLMVVTALKNALEGWTAVQDDLPRLSSNSSHWSIAGATHDSLIEDKANASLASQAIREVVLAVRTSKPLPRH